MAEGPRPSGRHARSAGRARVAWHGACALPVLAAALFGCSDRPAIRGGEIAWLRDLYPAATGRNANAELKESLMGATKTNRVVVRRPGTPVRFEHLDLPDGSSLRFRYRLLPDSAWTSQVVDLELRLFENDRGAPDSAIRVAAPAGPGWHRFETVLPAGRPVKRLGLVFGAPGAPPPAEARVAVLRPEAWVPGSLPRSSGTRKARRAILVTLDTFRRDHLGAYGSPDGDTPELDAFAHDAVRFEHAFSAANVTNPSHASIFTSLYPKDHGVVDNFRALGPNVPMFVDRLREEGLRTAAFVAAFNFTPKRAGFARHFDDFSLPRVYFERRAEDVNTDFFQWLSSHWQDEFFVWIHYFDAHMPYDPPAPFDALPLEGKAAPIELPRNEDLARWMRDSDDVRSYRSRYRGEIRYLDQQFGVLVRYLKRLGLYDDTLIVVTADHGESLGEHGIYCEHLGLYDETTAVPLLVKLPRSEHAGIRRALVSTLDIGPTVLDYLGIAWHVRTRGRSLRSLVEGAGAGERAVYTEHAGLLQQSIRTSHYRAIESLGDYEPFPSFTIRSGRFELYDVRADPKELHDLSRRLPSVASSFRQRLDRFARDRVPLESAPIVDEEYRRKLKALGYER